MIHFRCIDFIHVVQEGPVIMPPGPAGEQVRMCSTDIIIINVEICIHKFTTLLVEQDKGVAHQSL